MGDLLESSQVLPFYQNFCPSIKAYETGGSWGPLARSPHLAAKPNSRVSNISAPGGWPQPKALNGYSSMFPFQISTSDAKAHSLVPSLLPEKTFFSWSGKWDLLGRSNRRRGPPGAIRQMARVAFLSGGFASASVPQRFAHLGAFRWGQWIGRGTSDL